MLLNEKDRRVLFGTSVVSEQIVRMLSKCNGKSASLTYLRECFRDLSAGYFLSSIYTLRARGIVEETDGKVVLLDYKEKDRIRDQIWNAVKLLKTFSSADIRRVLPDVSPKTISNVLRSWELANVIMAISSDPSKRYAIVDIHAAKPAKQTHTEAMNQLAGELWRLACVRRTFTTDTIVQDAADPRADANFVKRNIEIWLAHDIIEPLNEQCGFAVKSDEYLNPSQTRIPKHLRNKIENMARIGGMESMKRYIAKSAMQNNKKELTAVTRAAWRKS